MLALPRSKFVTTLRPKTRFHTACTMSGGRRLEPHALVACLGVHAIIGEVWGHRLDDEINEGLRNVEEELPL